MADKGPGIATGAILGGFLCLGLIFLAIAAAIVLSLIPVYTQNNSDQGYGSVYGFDALMLKMFYNNISALFNSSTIGNSTDLSQRCTQFLQSKGYKNVAGCVLFNGKSWGPYSGSGRRRRATEVIGYNILSGLVAYTTSCPSGRDINKTEDSTPISSCVHQRLLECNSLVNDVATVVVQWVSNGLILEILATDGVYRQVAVNSHFGVPRQLAAALASSLLSGVTADVIASLGRGCRYIGPAPISVINALLASQTASNVTTDATTAPSG